MRSRLVPRIGLGLVGAAVLTAIVFIAIGERGPLPPLENSDVPPIYGGVPQERASLGSTDAPVTVSVFADLQCTDCAEWFIDNVTPLVDDYARAGEATLDFRHFSIGPRETNVASFAATAAGLQGRQWQYIHVFYVNVELVRTGVTEEFLERVAAAVPGLDVEQWEQDRDLPEVEETVRADAELAMELRLPAMPAVVVDGPGGTRQLEDSPSLPEIEAAIGEVG
jgi:protein-disulfide isomerase